MGELFNTIMAPLEYGVSWILVTIHTFLVNIGVPQGSGLSWGPSIIILVVMNGLAIFLRNKFQQRW